MRRQHLSWHFSSALSLKHLNEKVCGLSVRHKFNCSVCDTTLIAANENAFANTSDMRKKKSTVKDNNALAGLCPQGD